MQKTYNLKQIRYLLTDAFDDHEIQILCFDCFRPVFKNFSKGMDTSTKIINLVDYCERHGILDKLLANIKERNLYQFDKYKDKLFIDYYNITKTTTIHIKVNGEFPDLTNQEHLKVVETKISEALSEIQEFSTNKETEFNVKLIELTQIQEYSINDDNGSD